MLVVADEVEPGLWSDAIRSMPVDLLLAAGDLPFDYLEFLVDALDRPGVFVPGNHDLDLDLGGFDSVAGIPLRAGFPSRWPGPRGWINADGEVVTAAGLRIAGLGGSIRYNDGPNQWTEAQQARRARRLVRKARRRPVDVLLTHSPPRGVGDREDPPHRGFECLRDAVDRLHPAWMLHGHIHPHGEPVPDHQLGATTVRNVVGHRFIEIARSPANLEGYSPPIQRRWAVRPARAIGRGHSHT